MIMFSSIASASHSSSGMFGCPTGMTNYGGTSTSSSTTAFGSPFVSGFGTAISGFTPSGFSLVNGPQAKRVTFNLEQSQLGENKGSRIAVYKATAEAASKEKIVSISAMPVYNAKNHEELRWEDYNLTGKGVFGLTSSAVKSTSPATNFEDNLFVSPKPFRNILPSLASQTTTWKYPGPTSTSFTSQPLQFSTSANTCLTTVTSAPSSSFNPFIPKTNFTSAASTTVTSAPSSSFNPFIPRTNLTSAASTASSVSLAPFNHNPFANPSTSLATFTSPATNFPTATSSSFTSQPLQFSTSANTFLPSFTSAPSSSFNPFSAKTNLTSAASTASSVSFAPFNHNPFTNPSTSLATLTSPATNFPTATSSSFTSQPLQFSTSANTFLPTFPSAPSSSFNPFSPKTNLTSPPFTTVRAASTASPVLLAPLNYNLFTNSSNSLPTLTSSSCPSFATFTSTALNSGFNPGVPSVQNSNGTTGIIGESTVSQLSSSQIASTGEPSIPASPFGTLPPNPCLFFDGFQSKQPIQYGISSMTVKDKPAPVKYSMLTARHLSGRTRLRVRKYDPKLNAPKKPYFSVTEEIPVAAYVPRENPRALVVCPEKWPPRTMIENIHGEEISGSTYENERDDQTKEEPLHTTILDVPSKLQQPDYYTQPQISELEAKERAEPGFCRHVKDFVVGRQGYGSIKFLGETDVRKVDIEADVQFNNREVIVYMDDSKKPPVGEGLNKPAEITLLNIKCIDKKTGMQYTDGSRISKYTEMLKKKAETQGCEFISYDPVEGEWKFRVQHF